MKEPDWETTFEPMKKPRKFGAHNNKWRRAYLSNCNGKRSYQDHDAALGAAQILVNNDKAFYLRVYRCPTCNKWHLTSKPPQKRR